MTAAVTFVRCTDTSTRPSFPRNHSWMPDKATTVDETCLERTISALRRFAIPLDFIMKQVSAPSACCARARERVALWACNRYRILPAACAVPVARILIGVWHDSAPRSAATVCRAVPRRGGYAARFRAAGSARPRVSLVVSVAATDNSGTARRTRRRALLLLRCGSTAHRCRGASPQRRRRGVAAGPPWRVRHAGGPLHAVAHDARRRAAPPCRRRPTPPRRSHGQGVSRRCRQRRERGSLCFFFCFFSV
jgi:hypothetical protein